MNSTKCPRSTAHRWLSLLVLSTVLASQSVHAQNYDRSLIVEKIEIVGNLKTKDQVILKKLSVKAGDEFTSAELADAIDVNNRRLAETNFFKDVEFYTRRGSEKGNIVVVVEVKERRWPYFQFEGGHNDLDGWFFVPASLRFDNFFGRGNLIGLRWQLGDRVTVVSLGYRNANLFDGRAFVDFELLAGGHEFIHYLGATRAQQKVTFGGVNLTAGGNQGLFKYVNFSLKSREYEPDAFLEFVDLDSTTTSLPSEISKDVEQMNIGTLAIVLNADFRDNPVYPLRGFWGALSLESSKKRVGSDRNFSKITFDARFFQRVSKRNVVALHLKGGYAEPNTPFYERFYLGGANSLRGYRDRRLTPLGWGTKLILGNAEFRFPLSSTNFPFHKASGVLFFDAGGTWSAGKKPNRDELYSALGLGFRVKLPVLGTTRFDFSFPLKKVDNEDFRFHISLGHTF